MVKLSIVRYINSMPFLKGLEKFFSTDELIIQKDIPSECARKLINKDVQIGLVPVAAIPQIENATIISDYCIGSDGPVGSVLLLSNSDKHQIKKIYLDNESRTSNQLMKIIARKFWKIDVDYFNGEEENLKEPEPNAAYIIIGDRAYRHVNYFEYVFDLSEEWKKATALPFVFACWVANTDVQKDLIIKLNKAFEYGIAHIDELLENMDENLDKNTTIKQYLTEFIDYDLTDEKKKALMLFNKYSQELNAIEKQLSN